MRILEARESFIKIESETKVSISSFLKISDSEKSYIAQVIQSKKLEESFIVFAKILFIYDGILKNYDNSIPDKESQINDFTFEILNKALSCTTPIVAGKFIDGDFDISIDKKCFDKKTFISIDTAKYAGTIISNLSHQFKKSLIIDMSGIITGKKFIAGSDFRLPLNTASLEFMYEDCLNDATADSKSLIKEIFNDLSEYSKTVPFLPFGALKSIVDNMVDKEHVFKLLVLKNKLAKFDKQGYFAAKSEEAENLQRILNLDSAIIDLSKLDTIFQNRYLSTIYSIIETMSEKPQVFIHVSNTINKKNLKQILTSNDIPAVFATHSKFKYINEIKTMFDNFIIEPSFTNNEVFKIYSAFLNGMTQKTCLIVGEGTNYIPFVSSVEEYTILPPPEKINNIVTKEEIVAAQQEEIVPEHDDSELDEISDIEEIKIAEQEEIEQDEAPLEAIEKKSEELIEQAATEIEDSPLNLFDVEEEEEDVELENIEDPQEIEESVEILPENEIIEAEQEETLDEVIEPEIIEQEEAEVLEENELLEEDLPEETELEESPIAIEEEDILIEESEAQEFHTETDDIQTIEIPEDISEFADQGVNEEGVNKEETELEEVLPDINTDEIKLRDYSEEKDLQEEPPLVIPIDSSEEEFDEIVELDESEISEDDIIVDFEDEDIAEDDLDKEIVEDVDKVFTTMKDDSISDSDLDFIDELNEEPEEELPESLPEGMEELTELEDYDDSEDVLLEPIQEVNELNEEPEEEKEILETRNTSTPIVPVYDAEIPPEDMVMSDPIEQGDTVTHAKYGSGVVEKMIKYGTKTLYSINFDNVGRRLLDPTLTEIKKG